MQPCGNPGYHLSNFSYSYASSLPEKRIQNSAILEFFNGRFEALQGNETHVNYMAKLLS